LQCKGLKKAKTRGFAPSTPDNDIRGLAGIEKSNIKMKKAKMQRKNQK